MYTEKQSYFQKTHMGGQQETTFVGYNYTIDNTRVSLVHRPEFIPY